MLSAAFGDRAGPGRPFIGKEKREQYTIRLEPSTVRRLRASGLKLAQLLDAIDDFYEDANTGSSRKALERLGRRLLGEFVPLD